ncbi:MAG: hypothetical protein Q6373_012905 [Candidatus Sigynarchaeota archaeon]
MVETQQEFIVVDKEKRFGFIDQFRGIVILLFVIADITWNWSGNITGVPPVLPVGPTWLNHGWKFYDFDYKQMITLIDIGQLLFVFVMGLMIPLSWKQHKAKGGTGYAVGQLLVRLGWFYLIAGVMGDFDLTSMFLTNTFAVLAASMVFATLAAALVKDPDKRLYLNIALLIALGILYAPPYILNGGPTNGIAIIPLNLLGATIVAIQGGIFMEWFVRARDTNSMDDALRRIMKASVIAWVACFIMDYFWWADHHAMNVSIVLMSIGAGGFLLVIFHYLETKKFSVIGLNPFGRNTLLAFMLALPFQFIVWDLLDLVDTYKTAPWPISPLMGIVSVVIMLALYYAVLVPFDRMQWYFTPSIFIRAIRYVKEKKARSK